MTLPGNAVLVKGVVREFAEGPTIVTGLRCDRLAIRYGEFVAVCGPSGSGKSTLLGLMAGIDKPTRGDVHVLGRHLTGIHPASLTAWRAEEVGLVFQDPHLIPHLSAMDNLILARLPWSTALETTERAMELLRDVDLEAFADTRVSLLSRGQQQRVGLVRALIHSPKLLLADEPTASLDRDTATRVLALLERLRASARTTVVLATHDQATAAAADRQHDLVAP